MMLLICCFASVSAAQAAPADGGVDIRAAIDVPITLQVHSERRDGSDETTHPKYLMSGLNGTISLGYRWMYGGIYIDQELMYMVPTFVSQGGDHGFLGGTYLMGRAIFPINDRIQLDLGVGIGIMYSDGVIKKYAQKEDRVKYENDIAFAAKASTSFLYYFNDWFSLGFSIDYSLGIQKEYHDDFYRHYTRVVLHNINPGLLFGFKI
jgi:hypothetical protein